MTSSAVIRRRGDDVSRPTAKFDAYFCETDSNRLVLPDDGKLDELASRLGYRVVTQPNDLRTHVQRILVCLRRRDEPSLRGSLVDLFIALGSKGKALKLRMLEITAPILSRTATAFLKRHVDSGFKPWDIAIAEFRMSLLSLGYIGRKNVILKHQGKLAPPRDPIATARDCMELGQLDVALDTLEAALRINPDDQALARELLPIYEKGVDPKRAARMRQYIGKALNNLPSGWESISEIDGSFLNHKYREAEYSS